MELIRGLHNIRASHRGCVAAIGNFDGIHLGHQQVIKQLIEQAKIHKLPALLITFEPHPKEFFSHSEIPARLTRLREKLQLVSQTKIDRVLVIRFNKTFSQLSAEHFVRQILVDALQIKYLIVGDDFSFGHNRAGNVELLRQLGEQFDFKLATVTTLKNAQQQRVSSSAVRAALAAGDLLAAKQLLGRCYSMWGRVAHGQKRGRIIGFPTANIYLHRQVSPLKGVYAVKVYGLEQEPLMGVANLGNRPTVDGTRTLLEIHLFDFDQQIYGQYLRVDFIHKLRDERKFESFELLKQQIFKDAQQARDLL